MNELSLFDPTPTEELSDPASWFMQHRIGGPDMGSLLLTDPEKAVQKLAEAGVPPPPSSALGYAGGLPAGGRTGGADIPEPPGATFDERFGNAPAPPYPPHPAMPPSSGPKDPSRYPSTPPVQTRVPNPPPMPGAPGSALDPEEPPVPIEPPPPGAPLDIRSEAQTRGTPDRGPASKVPQPSDWQKALAATKVLAPPTVSPVSTPSPPVAKYEASPGVHFAPAPHPGHIGGVNNQGILNVMQALRTPQGAALLSSLLRR